MSSRSKFKDLDRYFGSVKTNEITLTLGEIERIIGQKLCDSAYKYPAYWYDSKTHMLPKCWTQNGYKMEGLNLKEQNVRFRRVAPINISCNDVNIIENNIPDVSNNSNRKQPIVSIDMVLEGINKYFHELMSDENARYLSWEHCYNAFQDVNSKGGLNDEDIDHLSLHLAFYLASWGMLRGSSFLLQKDYRVHIDVIEELYKPDYRDLWAINYKELYDQKNLDTLMVLISKLKNIYNEKRKNVQDVSTDISDILITKVLLGTMGVVPAYDEFFKRGVGKYGIATQRLGKSSIMELVEYYNDNEIDLEIVRNEISKVRQINYPQMKILDMAFWQLGFDYK